MGRSPTPLKRAGLKKQICRIYTYRFQKIVCAYPKFMHAHLYILFNSIIFASPAKAATCKNLHFIFSVSYIMHNIDVEFSPQVFAGGVLGFAVATFTGMIAGLGS
jgi:hypothetical protein